MVSFKCIHCGACCIFPSTQINLTLGDIARISNHLKVSPSKLINEEYFEPSPFFNPQNPLQFDIELGLHKPCKFWKNNRCSIYEARPLNCRLFPIWMFAKLPADIIKEQALEGYDCVNNTVLKGEDIPVYDNYTEKISEILLHEAILTEHFMRVNNMFQKIDITLHKDIVFNDSISPDEKINFLNKVIKNQNIDLKKTSILIDEELKDSRQFLINEKLNEIEKILI